MIKKLNIYLLLKLLMQASLLVGLSIAVYRMDWLNIFIIATIILLTLIPMRVSTRFSIAIPVEVEVMTIALIYASLYLGEIGDYYEKFWWWDILLHSGSGFLFGMLGFLMIWFLNEDKRVHLALNPFFMSVFSFSFSIVTGVIWEIFEFFMDQTFGMNMQKSGLVDTMWDMIVVCLGAFVVSGFGYVYLRFGYRSFASSWLEHFVNQNPKIFNEPKTNSSTGLSTENKKA